MKNSTFEKDFIGFTAGLAVSLKNYTRRIWRVYW